SGTALLNFLISQDLASGQPTSRGYPRFFEDSAMVALQLALARRFIFSIPKVATLGSFGVLASLGSF
ncbi:hypothetical protein, partial [Escherichia coli]|uniref:hypothetical protein n=1 Tax=Escherichia coli TaxID=562 RepID=UPI0032DB0540